MPHPFNTDVPNDLKREANAELFDSVLIIFNGSIVSDATAYNIDGQYIVVPPDGVKRGRLQVVWK